MKLDNLCKISLKQQGDNEVTKIEIDIADWQQEFADGTYSIVAKRPNEDTLYIANTTVEGNNLIWVVNAYDTNKNGFGSMQVVMTTLDERTKYSQVVLTEIVESQQGAISPEPPMPTPSWIEQLIEKAQQIINAKAERFYIDDNGHLIVEKVDGEIVDLGRVQGLTEQEVVALIQNALTPINGRLDTAETNIDTLANGLDELGQDLQELDNAKLDKESVVNDYSTAQDTVYSSDYTNSNFAPLGLAQPLFAVKDESATDTPTANLELTAPTPSNANILQATLQQKGVYDWATPDFTFIRRIAQNVSLSPTSEYRLDIAFILSQTTDINFGVKMKASTDNGETWAYISDNLSFGSQTYVAEEGNTAILTAKPNALATTMAYPQGTLIAFELYSYQNDHNAVTMSVYCGVVVRGATVNSTVQFGVQSLSINTEQIEDGAITKQKLAQEVVNDIDGKLDKVTTTAINNRAYIVRPNGSQSVLGITAEKTPLSLVIRDSNGRTKVASPTESDHAVNKEYYDDGLNTKVDKVSGKDLSTNDYTDEDKEKLDGIESGAEVNNEISQDLTAQGFTPVANIYYKHTGTTTATFISGVIYFYTGTEYKAINGSGSPTVFHFLEVNE